MVTVHLVKTMKARIVETKCNRDTVLANATVWAGDVTCPDCLAGRAVVDERRESFEALLR